jgi:hypothetical protein
VELLVKVTDWAELTFPMAMLPKVSAPGVAMRFTTPFPLRGAVCGLFDASSVIVSVPVREPATVGLNVIPILHDFPPPRLTPMLHVLLVSTLKSPLAAILERVSDAF